MLTQSQTDIVNVALMRIGQNPIQSITDQTDPNAIAARIAWPQTLGFVSRETPWNCLRTRACLTQLAPPVNGDCGPAIPPQPDPWTPNTAYAVNDYVTYAGQLYQCLIANTSSASFTNDLTQGYWFETIFFYPNYLGPYPGGNAGTLYEWAFAYALPNDFLVMYELNGNNLWGPTGLGTGNTTGNLYEIYQNRLYCNTPYADIKYNRLEADTTKYDTMFIQSLTLKLAATMATTLRKDDMNVAVVLEQLYYKSITRARAVNAGEGNPRRYNIVSQSRFVASRYSSTNG